MTSDTAVIHPPISLIDLAAQRNRLGAAVDKAILGVLDHGQYIMGPEVPELEGQLATFTGSTHAVTCASGTDALVLALRALGIGSGDAVLVPTFTFAATAEAVALVGATPVFCDVLEDSFCLDPVSMRSALDTAHSENLRARAVIPVDLFGQPADYSAIGAVADEAGIEVIADAAQSFGAMWSGRQVGSLARLTATSFFPAKPLGCYGDGGAVFTDDDALAERVRSLRAHGRGTHKYDHVHVGMNSRLDTVQAAILIEKLAIFTDELIGRQQVAARYAECLSDAVRVPTLRAEATSAWAQYTIVVPGDRDEWAVELGRRGVPSAVYYPLPLHRQDAYRGLPQDRRGLAVSERLASRVLSLPMHPYLGRGQQQRVIDVLVELAR